MSAGLATCPVCGSPSETAARYCRYCGLARSAKAAAAARDRDREVGEHKQITVLCADVQGSLALAEQVEPEDWHAIMSGLFAIIGEAARRYGGTVSRFTGDGVVALFGAPLAQEDHAHRAGHAALYARDGLGAYADDLRRARGLSFSVRIGMHSGDVVVSRFGDEPGLGYTAIGHTVGLAERMERLAEPGKIYVTEATANLVGGLLDVRDLGRFNLRGLPEPQRVYELVAPGTHRTRLDQAGARGFSPFVGREEPMGRLVRALDEATRGAGQVVEVMGEPGVGKSRLCHELSSACRRRGIRVIFWHAHSHLSSAAGFTFIEDFRRILGVAHDDPPPVVRDKISRALCSLDAGLERFLPVLFDVIGVAEQGSGGARDPGAQVVELARAAERFAHAASSLGTVVVIMEDLHWIDDASARMLEAFLSAVPSLPLLAVLTCRPEYRPPRPVAAERIELEAFSVRQAAELVGTLLGPDPSVLGIAGRILERAAGNPFFIEEIVWSLVESGALLGKNGSFLATRPAEHVLLPASLQASLGARIDRLGPFEKRVLHTAAVIGQEVSARPLETVLGSREAVKRALRRLVREGFLTLGAPGVEPERYRFSHPLLWEEAYRSQLAEVRARTHTAVALALIESDLTRLDERAGVIAQHWESGGDALQAARWLARSARWLESRKLNEALASWRRVVALVRGRSDVESLRLGAEARVQVLELGSRVEIGEAEARALFEEGRGLGARLADGRLLARISAAYGQICFLRGDARAAVGLTEGALAIGSETGDANLIRELQASLALGYYNAGRYRDAAALVESALGDGLSPSPEPSPEAENSPGHPRDWTLLLVHAMAVLGLGRIEDSRRELAMVLEAAEHRDDRELLCLACSFAPVAAQTAGDDPAAALAQARRSVALAIELASPIAAFLARWGLGIAELGCADFASAEVTIEAALADARRRGIHFPSESGMIVHLAEAALGRGAYEIARERAEAAIEMARRSGMGIFEASGLLVLARARLFSAGSAASAEIAAALDRVRALIRADGTVSLEPSVHLIEGLAALSRGDATAGRAEIARAQAKFAATGAHGHALRLGAMFGLEATA